jgi:exodeoxyribonuclease VII large subunit
MAKNVKTQWEFGELFGPTATRQVLTVSELTGKVRLLLERHLGQVWVTGEVSNLRAQSSGHIYFTLKDAGAQLSCVLFRGEPAPHRELLRDGQKLNLLGDFTVYEPRGQYQMVVRSIELQGTGALQLAFERLKQKLQAEGLFAPERKRPLPRYPQRIGLVTSPAGAAIRDVLHVIGRRQPGLEILVASCRVQGEGAAQEIACAIRLLNEWGFGPGPSVAGRRPLPDRKLDLILVTRGGGSLEDLWAFNEEVVARAIFESAIPIVSAVGHEIDFTISDFVADVRAATPSAAAEVITEGAFASRQALAEMSGYLRQLARRRLEQAREDVRERSARLGRLHPRRLINEKLQFVDDLVSSLARCALSGLRHHRTAWQNLRLRLARLHPGSVLPQRWQALLLQQRRIKDLLDRRIQDRRYAVANMAARLRLLSPADVLARGYSITFLAESGQILRHAPEAKPGLKLLTKLKDGEVRSVVEKTSAKAAGNENEKRS